MLLLGFFYLLKRKFQEEEEIFLGDRLMSVFLDVLSLKYLWIIQLDIFNEELNKQI